MNKRICWLLVFLLTAGPWLGSFAHVRAEPEGPSSLTAVSVSGGMAHTLAVMSDGTVRAWGLNMTGQLGNGSNASANVAMPVYESYDGKLRNLIGIVAVAAGAQFSLALEADGTVYSWGMNYSKELGRPTAGYISYAAEPIPGLPKIKQISAGDTHSLALAEDGTVWAWGDNQFGQAGIGTSGNNNFVAAPVQVKLSASETLANIAQISAAGTYSLALTKDGRVLGWGYNRNWQLGDGTLTPRSYPVNVTQSDSTPLQGVKQIAGGSYHALAVKADGTVWAWGTNKTGQLGSGGTVEARRAQPVIAPSGGGPFGGVKSVAAGYMHSVALGEDGTLWTWGSNSSPYGVKHGQLGRAPESSYESLPGQVTETEDGTALSGIAAIAAGQEHTLVLKSDGTIWSAGDNSSSQLGGNRTEASVPKLFQTTLSALSKAAWQPVRVVAGEPTNVTLQLTDAWGRPAKLGTDKVTMRASAGRLGPAAYIGDGKFAAVYRFDRTGEVEISAKVNGLDVPAKAQFSVVSGTPAPEHSAFDVTPSVAIADGSSPVKLLLRLRDAYGNELTPSAGSVSFSSTLGEIGTVTEAANGVYEAELRSRVTGQATVSAVFDGVPFGTAKTVAFMAGAPDSGYSVMRAEPNRVPADGVGAAKIVLQLKDASGNSLTQSGGAISFFSDLGRLDNVVETVYGVYETKLTSSTPGTATVSAAAYGQLMASPVTVRFVPPVSGIGIAAERYELLQGETLQAAVKARYWDDHAEDITAYSVWSVRDPSVANVSAAGLVSGLSPGETVLIATYGAYSATAAVKVHGAGDPEPKPEPKPDPEPEPKPDPGLKPKPDPADDDSGSDESGSGSGGTAPSPVQPGNGGGTEASPSEGKAPDRQPDQPAPVAPGNGAAGRIPFTFTDVSGHWAAADIYRAAEARIVDGFPDGSFRPDAKVTRAEFAVMLTRALPWPGPQKKQEPAAGEVWPDWASEAIGRAMAAGIAQGYEDGTFRPDAYITRSEMIAMLVRAAAYANRSLTETSSKPVSAFADGAEIPAWAQGAYRTALSAGLLEGDDRNRLHPLEGTTRAEAVTVLLRLIR